MQTEENTITKMDQGLKKIILATACVSKINISMVHNEETLTPSK